MRRRTTRSRCPREARALGGPAAAICAVGLLCAGWRAAGAQVFLTQEEALELAFPAPAAVERRTAFLEEADLSAARTLAGSGVDVDQSVVTYYVASRNGEPIGAAYFDVHRVRTLPVVLMVVVTPDERIERVEILKWAEPPEYRAPPGWLRQIHGQALTGELSLKGAIRNMTGATLTSQAITRAARRVLALHRIVRPFGAPTARPDSAGSGIVRAGGAPAGPPSTLDRPAASEEVAR